MSKTVLITGSSSGIGKATAIFFANNGWNVAATMRSPHDTPDFASFDNLRQYKLDVTDASALEAVIQEVLRDFGIINVLVNNAGYATVGAFEASTPEQIEQQFDVNVFGLMNMTRLIIPIFRTQGYGHIVNVGSMGGRLTFPLYSAYHATKWAVDGFSESLMYELKPFNICVKLIEPGLIKSQFAGKSEVRFNKNGLSAYDKYADKTINGYHQTYTHATAPETVAKTIYKASISTSGKLRYVVGMPAPLLLSLRRILPERLYFALVRTGARKQ